MRKKSNVSDSILNSAYALFGEYGFSAVSVKKICEHADIAYGTFYNYFVSKDELLHYYIKNEFQKVQQQLDRILTKPLIVEQLLEIYRIYVEIVYTLGADVMRHYFEHSSVTLTDTLMSSPDVIGNLLSTLIKKAQIAGEISFSGQPLELYRYSSYLMVGLYFSWCRNPEQFDLYSESDHALRLLFR